jgi:hypothetical protein
LEDELKLVPVTCRVIAALPGAALEGERWLCCGTGLFTVNVTTTDGSAPGFVTVTIGVPATAIAPAGIVPCNSVPLKKLGTIVFPLKLTTELGVKLFPERVNVNDGPPAVVEAGDSAPTTGWMFPAVMVMVAGLDVPPPLVPFGGFVTVIFAAPGLAISPDEMEMLSCVGDW